MLSNEFNNHFATIGSKLASNISTSDIDNHLKYLTNTDKQFQLFPTTRDKVFSVLNKLNVSKATGLDMISARLIRECADLICIPICNIFNQSIRIVYDQLYAYLEEHSIICKYQSGFRSTHSTVTALLEATDTWAYNIDRGKINAVVFLDLKKAFDTVDHKMLLSKLSHYGICGNAYNWSKSYLENRTQLCSINGSLSKNRSLTCGVPQGTILGPLLFLLYINDLPNCLSNCESRMYADDTHLTYAGDCVDNLQLYLNQDLDNVHDWLRANKLTLNMTKTEFMLIGSRQRLSTLTDGMEKT